MFMKNILLSIIATTLLIPAHAKDIIVKRPSQKNKSGVIYRKLGQLEIAGDNLVVRKIKLQEDSTSEIERLEQDQQLGYELDGYNPTIKLVHRKIEYWDYSDTTVFYVQETSDDSDGEASKCFEKQISEISQSKYFNKIYENDLASINIVDYRESKHHESVKSKSNIKDISTDLHESSILNINLIKDKNGTAVCRYLKSKEIDSYLKSVYPVIVSFMDREHNSSSSEQINNFERDNIQHVEKQTLKNTQDSVSSIRQQ